MKDLLIFFEQDIKSGLIILFACCLFTVFASLFDMWTALEAVKATGGKPESRPMKKTGQKIMDNLRLIFFVVMIDILGALALPIYNIPYCTVIITLGILVREGLSMKENFQLKKSNAADVLELSEKIVKCLTSEEANKIIKEINKVHTSKQNKLHNATKCK